jgi:hypothetical protein
MQRREKAFAPLAFWARRAGCGFIPVAGRYQIWHYEVKITPKY